MNNDFNLFDEMFGQSSFSETSIPDPSRSKENKPSIHAEAIQTDIKPSAPDGTASAAERLRSDIPDEVLSQSDAKLKESDDLDPDKQEDLDDFDSESSLAASEKQSDEYRDDNCCRVQRLCCSVMLRVFGHIA